MEINQILIALLLGAIAGWLAGKIFRGSGYGLIGDIVLGIVGSSIGSFLLAKTGLGNLLTLKPIWLNQIIVATIGALILVAVMSLFRSKKK